MNVYAVWHLIGALAGLSTGTAWPLEKVSTGSLAVQHGPSISVNKRHRAASLLRKRWDWKSASSESLTETGIVLKRYYMVDMELSDLCTQLSLLLPISPETGGAQAGPTADDWSRISSKIGRIAANLQAAAQDQSVSDTTFSNMEVDPKLTTSQKQVLLTQHQQEVQKSEELADSGQLAKQHGEVLLRALHQSSAVSAGSNLTHEANSTIELTPRSNQTSAVAPVMKLFSSFKDAVEAFQSKRAAFEDRMRASSARLVEVAHRQSKVVIQG